MKTSEKIIMPLSIINVIGLMFVVALPGVLQIALIISTISSIIFFNLENAAFCKRLDRIMNNDENITL